MIVFGSGTTDPYQPCEEEERLTGRCAETLAAFVESPSAGAAQETLFPGTKPGPVLPSAMVLTKSALIRRDLPLWRRINDVSGFMLLMTITGLDEEVRRHFEPGAFTVKERLDTLQAFRDAGIPVGVLAMPLLPHINDDEQSLRALYSVCREIGVEFIMPGGLTLRPGRQKMCYLEAVKERYPKLIPETESMYRENRPSGAPVKASQQKLHRIFVGLHRQFEIPWLLPHRVYRDLLPAHDTVRVLLQNMIELYDASGRPVTRLREAAKRYDDWLTGLRRVFRRRRSLPVGWLETRFTEARGGGELARVLGNPKTAAFVERVAGQGAVFNYLTLKLEEGGDA